ncbi:MAG: ABC transporter ATP-binding protein/permease [Actinomycetia bacterium]|nr:ABC transporter ATP-binding protein/permease [Actinomycetes bacterium]
MSHQSWSTLRSFARDASVAERKLTPGTVRRVAGYAVPYRRPIIYFLVLTVIDAILVVASPLLLLRLIDDGVTPGDKQVVVTLALIVAGLAVFDALLSLILRWYSARIGEGLIYDLRSQVFDHVQRMPLAFFVRTQTGALISRLNSDVIGAQQAFTTTLSSVVSNAISLVVVTIAMLALSWQITLAALVLLPVFLIPARYVGRRLAEMSREAMQLNAEMSSTMTERFNVSGALLVKLFGRPDEEATEFSGRARRVADIGIQIAMANRAFFTALTLIASLATALVYGVGGILAIDKTLTVGTLVALAALLGRLYGPLTALSNVRVDIMTALVSFERVFEVLDLKPMIADKSNAVVLPRGPASVRFNDVSFSYPRAEEVSLASLEVVARSDSAPSGPVLHNISFEVAPGQMVALVGPSGAGKTTLTSLVSRLYDVSDGQVMVGGLDVRDVSLSSLQRSVGVVTQDAHLFHDTIEANLRYASPEASESEMWDALRSARIEDLVQSFPDGLATVVGDRGHRLSGGEKQRLAIARLLLKSPSVVILDEATAHLDSESERYVQEALDTALDGRTSLVIAHRLSTVRAADQILVVDGGRIVERGDHDTLLDQEGLYADLYRTQLAPQL